MRACPTCHRPFGGKHRSCFACRRPILRDHRWHIEGCYILHDDCENPAMSTLFKGKAEPEAITGKLPVENEVGNGN